MTLCSDIMKDLGALSPRMALVTLRVLATSDLHATLMPFDYFTDRQDDKIGLLRVAGLVEAARAEVPNCLLLDNGDTFQGGSMGELAARWVADNRTPHPMVTAMNAMGYDAATLGNHDFDFGLALLDQILSEAQFPFVLANAHAPGNGRPLRPRHIILHRQVADSDGNLHALQVGVTGTVPPQTAKWNEALLDGQLETEDAVQAAAREARLLKASGADIVVVLAHSGLGTLDPAPEAADARQDPDVGAENVARRIAALPDVDMVVAGHTHEVYPPETACDVIPPDTPIVQPGYWGTHLGCLDIALSRPRDDPAQGWTVVRARSEALRADGAPGRVAKNALKHLLRRKPDLRQTIGRAHREARASSGRWIGRSEVALHTYFSALAPCRATQLMSDAMMAAARDTLVDRPDLRGLPLVSAVSPMRSGSRSDPDHYTDIPPGPLLQRHVSDIYCYPNALSILRLRGRDIATWLERAASLFCRIDPDTASLQPLIDHDFAGYNFDRLDGLTYEIDVSAQAVTNASGDRVFDTPGRIRKLRHTDGRPVGPDEELLVVTNTYRASGGGNFSVCANAERVAGGNAPVRDLIVDFISMRETPMHPVPNPTFTLRGFGKARPVFETGPGALDHAGEFACMGLSHIGTSDAGFARFELRPTVYHSHDLPALRA